MWVEIVSQSVCACPYTAVPSARRYFEQTVIWGTGVLDNSPGPLQAQFGINILEEEKLIFSDL